MLSAQELSNFAMTAYTLSVRHDEEPLWSKRCLLHPAHIRELGLSTGEIISITPASATLPVSHRQTPMSDSNPNRLLYAWYGHQTR